MSHPEEGRLHDYVDGLLEADAVREVAEHLEACSRCRARVEALRGLTARLGDLPRGITPRRDLRPDLSGVVSDDPGAGVDAGARSDTGAWLRAAAVAVAVIGAGAAVWLGVSRQDVPVASAPEPVVATYAQAADELAREVWRRKAELSPAAVGALEASLASVDRSIRDLERARARGMTEDELNRRLTSRYRTKLEILRGAVEWLEES